MSRCFPFPPPGYENKARPDGDANLLIKENHKDKKQKKDKEKEKKERRDKDKERSSEKNREKKERKHKHRDKKDKNRDKEEKKASEDKKIVAFSDHQNRENLGKAGTKVGENSRFLLELGKKVKNDDGANEMQIIERISATDISPKLPGEALEHNLGIFTEGIQKFVGKREENRIPDEQSVRVNAIGLANGFVSILPAKDKKFVGGIYQEGKVMEKQKERKDTNKQNNSDVRGDKQKDGDREKKSKSKDKRRKKEKKEKEKAKEEKVDLSSPILSKLRESGNNTVYNKNDRGSYLKDSKANNGTLSKRKEPEMDGFLNGNEIQNNKLPRPISSSHQVIQIGSKMDTSNSSIQFALKEATVQKHKSSTKGSSSVSVFENGRTSETRQTAINLASERQEAVSNHNKANDGFSLKPALGHGTCQTVMSSADMEHRLVTNHTLDKKVSTSQTVVENGRKLESSQSNLTAAERQEAVFKPKFSDRDSRINDSQGPELDERASRINGVVELKSPSASLRSPTAPGQLQEIVETCVKPPHPDTKFLSEILSVPKVEWSDVDGQSWLFSSEDHTAKKPKKVSTMIEESKQVWSQVLQIESADVTALPYVIPY
ncbi:hypothetical protein ACH5RR_010397 [Cinchona calisaya]|uniref:Uncharacterized protein n=1 Tax=Cinchona calisaya TaxID=153742 RepID=A0ABD3AIT9_9GENT